MVRETRIAQKNLVRFPHACGDGPRSSCQDARQTLFSPRVWGWSGEPDTGANRAAVFPTRVGMVRDPCCHSQVTASFPHACGDGPMVSMVSSTTSTFSPRVWGWSGPGYCHFPLDYVFPTRVGMVRRVKGNKIKSARFPHACGDGPAKNDGGAERKEFSPRVWGWSAITVGTNTTDVVFPTRVGMVRVHSP